MRGLSLGNALSLAADFVVACIEATASAENAVRWYAVEFESQIPLLCEMLDQRLKKIIQKKLKLFSSSLRPASEYKKRRK